MTVTRVKLWQQRTARNDVSVRNDDTDLLLKRQGAPQRRRDSRSPHAPPPPIQNQPSSLRLEFSRRSSDRASWEVRSGRGEGGREEARVDEGDRGEASAHQL